MSDKPDLSRAGTMAATAKEGKAFLDKNLTEWEKPFLIGDYKASKKQKISKQGTMKSTAKEGEKLLDASGRPDDDAHTRGQQKKIEDIKGEKKSKKKAGGGGSGAGPKKMSSMAQTAAEAKDLFGKELDLSSGRSMRKRPPPTVKPVVAAKKAKGKASPKKAKPDMKKEGTMQKTAKEGKEYLKRGRKSKGGKKGGKPKKADKIVEEKNEVESS